MKRLIIIASFFIVTSIIAYFMIVEETKYQDKEFIDKQKNSSFTKLQDKYKTFDINAKDLDIQAAIKEIKDARKRYPLDDRFKTIEIELENKDANKHKFELKKLLE